MDDIKVNQNPKLGSMDRPNSYIGRSLPRENAKKHLEGGGQFVDDLVLPRMLHVAFLRSPFAHAEIKSINVEEAKTSPGVFDVYTAKEIISSKKKLSRDEIRAEISGNYCRCTGYQSIVDAIEESINKIN